MNKKKEMNTSITVFIKALAFLIPMPLYLLFVVFIFPSPNSSFLFLGVVGTLFLGLGLVSITGLFDKMYFGHMITSILFGLGASMITISSFVMYTPLVYSKVNEQYMSLYFVLWTALIICLIWYIIFRNGITIKLKQSGLNSKRISELTQGLKNYWWYQSVQKTYDLKWLYYLNKLFTTIYAVTILVHLLLGWWTPIVIIPVVSVCTLCLLAVLLWGASLAHTNKTAGSITTQFVFRVILGLVLPVALCASIIILYWKV